MIEKWEKAVDQKTAFRAILTDVAKYFDCICQNLPLTQLHAYGLTFPALKLKHDFLRSCKQRVKSSMSYSIWDESLCAVA